MAGGQDKITPEKDVESLYSLASPGSKFIVAPNATHELLTYCFSDLVPPILAWLDNVK